VWQSFDLGGTPLSGSADGTIREEAMRTESGKGKGKGRAATPVVKVDVVADGGALWIRVNTYVD
jgi:hypothetical protein